MCLCVSLFLCGPVVRDVLLDLRYAVAPTTPHEEHAGKHSADSIATFGCVEARNAHSKRTSRIGAVSGFALDAADDSPALYAGPGAYGVFIAFAYI